MAEGKKNKKCIKQEKETQKALTNAKNAVILEKEGRHNTNIRGERRVQKKKGG